MVNQTQLNFAVILIMGLVVGVALQLRLWVLVGYGACAALALAVREIGAAIRSLKDRE